MGADGTILIWRSKDVDREWPDAKTLFDCIPYHYRDAIDGVYYDHVYDGNNGMPLEWDNPNDWYCSDPELRARLTVFMEWLHNHVLTRWEIWT